MEILNYQSRVTPSNRSMGHWHFYQEALSCQASAGMSACTLIIFILFLEVNLLVFMLVWAVCVALCVHVTCDCYLYYMELVKV